MKSSRLLPDGSQSRTAALVVVSMPHWRPAPMKRFPPCGVASAFSFLCVCGRHIDHTILNPEVLYVGRSMLIIDLGIYSLKHEAEHICLLVFHSVTQLTQSPAVCIYTVYIHCMTGLYRKFWKDNLDFVGVDGYKSSNQLQFTSYLWCFQRKYSVSLFIFYTALHEDIEAILLPSQHKIVFSLRHHYPIPRTPCSFSFKRRVVSWCLFEECVKYLYWKPPWGQTHKALTVSH